MSPLRMRTLALVALACLLAACAPREDAHQAVVKAKRRTFVIPAPIGMASNLGFDSEADAMFRVAVPSDLEMLAHFSPEDTTNHDWHASFEIARTLPEDDASSQALFTEMHTFMPQRYEHARASARPGIASLAQSLRAGQSEPARADLVVQPCEQVPITITRSDKQAIIGFSLIGMPESSDGSIPARAALVGTSVMLMKNRVTYLYLVGRLPAQGPPLSGIQPALETWTKKVLAANR